MNNEIKSQDDLNRQGRESDVLIATLNKCQDIVRKNVELENENKRLKGLLKEVKEFIEEENPKDYTVMSERMDELLTKIEEALK